VIRGTRGAWRAAVVAALAVGLAVGFTVGGAVVLWLAGPPDAPGVVYVERCPLVVTSPRPVAHRGRR